MFFLKIISSRFPSDICTCHAAAKLLLSCFSRVQLCGPTDAAHQAPPAVGFSRQEHWSGLPLSSLMYMSYKYIDL